MYLFVKNLILILGFLFIVSFKVDAATTSDFSTYRVGSDNLADCNASQCENVGSVCYNGPSSGDSGGCGTACGQGSAWTQYQVKCKNWEPDPDRPASCQETLVFMDRVCSTADKCDGSQPYLQAGSCSCGVGNTYKTCCTNTSPSVVANNACVQISVDTTNPPYEGVCPAGSHAVLCGFGGYPSCGQAACGDPNPPASAPPSGSGSCDATWTVNCCDGSADSLSCPNQSPFQSLGYSYWANEACANNGGYGNSCASAPPPPIAPPAQCSLSVSCPSGNATCTFNLDYRVSGLQQQNFQARLFPDTNNQNVYRDFTTNPTSWTYTAGTYTARVNVTGGDGAAVCETAAFTVNPDNTPPTCTSMTLTNSSGQAINGPVQRGTPVNLSFTLNDSGSRVSLAELFVDGTSEASFYNSLNQNPFQRSFGYNTSSLTEGTHTFVVNAIDNNGNEMKNNATCTKQITISTPNWVPPVCNSPGNFSGCTLQGGVTCSDAGPGNPQYSNWSQNLGNFCQIECAKQPADRCTTPVGTLTVPATVGRNGPTAWASMSISFNTTNTQGGEVFIHTSTCSQASCNPNVGWTLTNSTCTTNGNGSKTCTYTPPASIQPNTVRTFALFGKNPRMILDTKDVRFGQVCIPGERQAICTTNVCTI